jgi:hypothetical protein
VLCALLGFLFLVKSKREVRKLRCKTWQLLLAQREFACAVVGFSKSKENDREKFRTAPKHTLPFQTEHMNWIGRKETRGDATLRIKGKGKMRQKSHGT